MAVEIDGVRKDRVELIGGQVLYTHTMEECVGHKCSVHNRSNHHMRDWPQNWRSDRGIMELLCEHGVGHPDPDEIAFKKRILGEEEAYYIGIHGCDGCCRTPSKEVGR